MQKILVKRGIYEHYTGKHYEVIGTIRETGTDEALVLFRPLYATKHPSTHPLIIRPISEFLDLVTKDGNVIPRFRFLGASK